MIAQVGATIATVKRWNRGQAYLGDWEGQPHRADGLETATARREAGARFVHS